MPHSDPAKASLSSIFRWSLSPAEDLTRLGPGSTPASSEGSPPHSTAAAAEGLAARRLSIAERLTLEIFWRV